jgi:hypothetical protein
MATKTYEEVFTFIQLGNAWLTRNDKKDSKFKYGLTKELKAAVALGNKYNEQIEDIDIDHCATDDKGVILRDEKNELRFTKDGIKARIKARRELFKSSVEIEPYFASDVPDDLTEFEKEVFAGFVLRPELTLVSAEALVAE